MLPELVRREVDNKKRPAPGAEPARAVPVEAPEEDETERRIREWRESTVVSPAQELYERSAQGERLRGRDSA